MTKGDIFDGSGAPQTRTAPSGSLAGAIRRARLVEAERLDTSADRRDSEIARLELLRAELEPVFADIPRGDDRFALTLAGSRPARLWIDMFAHVAIGDEEQYELVRSSENGRRVLFSTPDIGDMRERVVSYVARQIVLKERQESGFAAFVRGPDDADVAQTPKPRGTLRLLLTGFVAGAVCAVAGLVIWVWLTLP